jgi:hypothetical protein
MPLKGPNNEDLRKIHAEINQLANQRFLLVTLAITLFGVATAWLIPKQAPNAGDNIGGLTFAVAILLSSLFFALYLLNHFLKGMQRVCTAYLVETKASGWEIDWEEFRQEPHYGYTKPQTLIFLILNGISTGFPFILASIYSLKLEPIQGFILCLILGIVVELLIYLMGFHGLFELHSGAAGRWARINK